jgi:hypothetical protein
VSWEDELAKGLAASLLLLVGELGRRMHKRRRESSRPAAGEHSLRPPPEVSSYDIPFARGPLEQCERERDCILVNAHPGDCYLTAWLFDSKRRKRWRRARGLPEGR